MTLIRKFSSTLAAVGLSAAALLAAPLTAHAQDFVSIKGKTANVRAQPNGRAEIAYELTAGYPLQVTQRKGQWVKVKDFEDHLGWIYTPNTHKSPHMIVTARVANLRAGPGEKHRVLGKMEQYEVVKTVKKTNGWVQVRRNNGQSGWISQRVSWGW